MKENNRVGWYVFSTTTYNQDHLFLAEIVGTFLEGGRGNIVLVRGNASELDLWVNKQFGISHIFEEYIVRKATELEIALC